MRRTLDTNICSYILRRHVPRQRPLRSGERARNWEQTTVFLPENQKTVIFPPFRAGGTSTQQRETSLPEFRSTNPSPT